MQSVRAINLAAIVDMVRPFGCDNQAAQINIGVKSEFFNKTAP